MNLQNLLNKKIIELEAEELEWMMDNATFGEMAEWIREEHQHLRALFAEMIYEINTMEMLNFIGKDNEETE